MNKEKAARFLGVSVRTLQRYTRAGRLSVKHVRAKHGEIAEYNKEELSRFKEELKRVTEYVRPAVVSDTPGAPINETALATLQPDYTKKLAAALEGLMEALRPSNPSPSIADLSTKLMLTLNESAKLTSLSRGFLLKSIRARKLKAQILGRGWKVKRADLEAFVKKL